MNDPVPHEPTQAAFDKGQTPTIVCVNKATVPLGVDFDALIAAMQIFVTSHLAPVWGTPARLQKGLAPLPGCWLMVLLDDADQPGALAYHDLIGDLPVMKVFVKTTLADKALVSVSASHELAEALVDAGIQMFAIDPATGIMYCYEVGDPVEEETFPITVQVPASEQVPAHSVAIDMTDFVYPSYFEAFRKPNSTKFDHLGKVTAPLTLLPGGYQTTFVNNDWHQTFGSEAKAQRFALEDRRGHRSEIRAAPAVADCPDAPTPRVPNNTPYYPPGNC